jgi:hypothetical protein
MACPYTSLPICYCSMYVRAPPNYMLDTDRLDVECNEEMVSLQSAILHDLMLTAGGAEGILQARCAPSPYELMRAKDESEAVPPGERLAVNLAVAADAAPTVPGSDALAPVHPAVSTPSSGGSTRGPARAMTDSPQNDGQGRLRRYRPRPRKSVP